MIDGALDALYSARPEDFTSLRTELAAKARKSGDTAAAKSITASRKPTTAAWVVNLLVLDGTARAQLTDLGSRLREAHAAMDGDAIRVLSSEQRRLVDELVRNAFRAAALDRPSAALRDDVTATLQAAVADPDVAARLGRLTKAERWSGFGDFGDTAAVSAARKGHVSAPRAAAEPRVPAKPSPRDRRVQQARAAVAAAERTKSEADAALAELQADLAAARLRHQDARRRLDEAEQAMAAAEDAYDAAKRAGREAAAAVKAAKQTLKDARG